MSAVSTQPYLARERIEHEAQQVLQRWEMWSLPVDPLAIAHREGIAVYNVKFVDESLSGSITSEPAGTTIRLNRDDPPARKRFTIAHELGHYFLHLFRGPGRSAGGAVDGVWQFTDGTNNLFRQPSKVRQPASDEARREYQANLFAAALLMPEQKVRTCWESYDSIWEMSRLFEVSDLAMSIRLGQLGLLDDQLV